MTGNPKESGVELQRTGSSAEVDKRVKGLTPVRVAEL
jgi:hypothetical protein